MSSTVQHSRTSDGPVADNSWASVKTWKTANSRVSSNVVRYVPVACDLAGIPNEGISLQSEFLDFRGGRDQRLTVELLE